MQTNFGGLLTSCAPVGRELGITTERRAAARFGGADDTTTPNTNQVPVIPLLRMDVLRVIATDARLRLVTGVEWLRAQCRAGETGAAVSNGSGDYAIAFQIA